MFALARALANQDEGDELDRRGLDARGENKTAAGEIAEIWRFACRAKTQWEHPRKHPTASASSLLTAKRSRGLGSGGLGTSFLLACQKLQTKLCVVDKAPTTSLPLELPFSLPARRTVTSPPVQLQAFGLRTATVAAVANMSKPDAANGNGTALNFKFVETPKAGPFTFEKSEDCGVRTTSVSSSGDLLACSSDPIGPPIAWDEPNSQLSNVFVSVQYPTIKNAPLPADAAGTDAFSNAALFSLLIGVPWYFSWKVGGGLKTTIFFALITSLPIISGFWLATSTLAPRKNEKAKFPGRPVEHYLTFKKPEDKAKYAGKNKIPMETFHEMYFDGEVDFNGDCLEVLEYRHDWASFRFTLSLVKFFFTGMIPEVIMHTRSQGMIATIGLVFRLSLTCPTYQMRSRSVTTTTAVMTFTAGSSARV